MAELHGDKRGSLPAEATHEMLVAAKKLRSFYSLDDYAAIWRVMVKAFTPSNVVPSKPIGARDGVLCYSPGDMCAGCDHYEGTADRCSYAPSTTPRKPTVITSFPGQAVEEYRLAHDGRLPTEDEPLALLRECLGAPYMPLQMKLRIENCLAAPSAIVPMPEKPTGAMLALIAGEDCERSFRTRQEALTVYYALRGLCRTDGGKQT